MSVEQPFLYPFVDACVEARPHADHANARWRGVTALGVAAVRPGHSFEEASEALMAWHQVVRACPGLLVADLPEDIRRAHAANRQALILRAQDGTWISNKLHRVEAFYRLGLRMMAPACDADNMIAGGSLDRDDLGLTRFGTLFVKEADRLGLLLDGSRGSERAGLDLAANSANPIVYSHANCRALVDDPRNITDEQIRSCVGRGGVIGVTVWSPLLRHDAAQATLADLCDHVDHIAQLTGRCDGIGIGSNTPSRSPDDIRGDLHGREGFDVHGEAGTFADELAQRGYRMADIEGIFGANLLRVFSRVWKSVNPATGTGAGDGGPESDLPQPRRA
jgi:membrane dipeptidase